jgi:hypothetical protein
LNPPRHTVLDRDPNDTWAEVELYRWQHGVLPNLGGPALDVPAGFEAMAKAIENGPRQGVQLPTRENYASALRYAASRIRSDRDLARRLWEAIAAHVECRDIEEARQLLEILEGFPKDKGQAGAVKLLKVLIETRPLVEGMR